MQNKQRCQYMRGLQLVATSFLFLSKNLSVCLFFVILGFTLRVNAASKLELEALLEMDLQQLVQVELDIASKTPESLLNSAGTVYVINEDEIRRFGWRDLREILEAVPAFSAVRSFDWFDVSLRGGGANMIKLLIDGREVQNLVADEAVIQESFPSHRIKRVEVLMGAHSTLYGSNAADGVINVITKIGSKGQVSRNELQLVRGEVGTSLLSAVMHNQFDDGHIGFTASSFNSEYNWQETLAFTQNNALWSRRDSDNLPDYSDPVEASYRSYSIALSAEMKGVFFNANIWQDSSPQGYNEAFSYWGERRSERRFDQWSIGSTYSFGDVEGIVEYTYTDEEDQFLEPDWNGSLKPTRHFIKAEANIDIEKHQLVMGVDGYKQQTEFRNDAVQDGGSGTIHLFPNALVHEIESSKTSLFVHDTYEFLPSRLTGVFGLRYEAYRDVESTVVPRVGLVYSHSGQSAIRLIYGGGFRAPNSFDLVRAENAGISSLAPIESDMLELGHTQALQGKNWSLMNNFSVYKYQIDGNYITRLVQNNDGGPGVFVLEPADSSAVSGVENLLKLEYEKLSGFFSGRISKPDKTRVAGEDIVKDVPKYKAKIGLTYDFSKTISASVFMDHWDDVKTEANLIDADGTEVYGISDWTTFDINLTFGEYKLGDSQVKFNLKAENITDEVYYHPLRGVSPMQVIQPPRHFLISADIAF